MNIQSIDIMPNFFIGGSLEGDVKHVNVSTFFHSASPTSLEVYSKCPFVYFLNDDVMIYVDILVNSRLEYEVSKGKAILIANKIVAPIFIKGGYTIFNLLNHKTI